MKGLFFITLTLIVVHFVYCQASGGSLTGGINKWKDDWKDVWVWGQNWLMYLKGK